MVQSRIGITSHWRDYHTPDELLYLKRDGNGDVKLIEQTSGETIAVFRRTGANTYTLYNNTVAGGKVIQDSSLKNVANGIAGLDASSKFAGLLSTDTAVLINAFGYTGNATANRALAHGIARKPKFAWIGTINSIANYGFQYIMVDGYIRSVHNTGDGLQTVTAWDATNIYVGNAGDYDGSANVNLRDYYVVVFG